MKKFVALLLSAVLALSLVSTGAFAEDKIDLQFYIWSDEEPYITPVVEQYNASQDKVNIVMNVIANDDYDDKLKVLLSGGADLDIIDIRGQAQVTTYVGTGSLLDLTDRINQSTLDVNCYGDQWNLCANDGKHYALPARTTCWDLYYNADLFDQAGLPYPTQMTWDEYAELAKQLQEKTGAYGGYWVPWIFPFASVQAGKYVTDEDTTYLKYSLELLNRVYNEDMTHMSYAEISATNADYIAEFENGNAAMLPNGEWCVQMLMEDAANGECDINWQVAPMPVPEGVEPGTAWGQFQFMGITNKCAHPDEAFDFLAYLCGPEGATIYAKNGMIHAYSGDEAKAAYMETVGKDSVDVFFNTNKIMEQPNTAGYDEVLSAFNEQSQLYLLGEKSIEDTMADFIAQRDTILAKY